MSNRLLLYKLCTCPLCVEIRALLATKDQEPVVVPLQDELKVEKEKRKFIVIKNFLLHAEKQGGFACGKYVGNVVVHALRQQFERCLTTSVNTMFSSAASIDYSTESVKDELTYVKEKVYTLRDSIGDVVASVRKNDHFRIN